MRAPDIPAPGAQKLPESVGPAGEQDTSLQEVSDRFASLFYRTMLDSMMDTIPGRGDRSPMGSAGWSFMKRFLPRSLSRGEDDVVGRYIRESLQSRAGGQVDAEM